MKEYGDTRRFRSGFLVFLLLMAFNLPPLFYSAFDADRFIGWPSHLGSRWFSAMADRMQLNYGCAPSAMLQNIEGFAFWHAVLLLLVATVAILHARKAASTLPLAIAGVAALIPVSAGLVYFDALLSRFPPPFVCRTT